MSPPDTVSGVDFSGEAFAVRSALVGTDYVIRTAAGEDLLWAKRRFFDERKEYEFRNDDDDLVFEYVRASPVEGRTRFEFLEADTGTRLATLLQAEESEMRWEVRPESTGEVAAYIEGETGRLPVIQSANGRRMDVTTADGSTGGRVRTRTLSIHFTFDVDLPELHGAAKAAALLAVPLLYDEMQPGSEFERGRTQ